MGKKPFTTTLDEKIIEVLKIEAIKRNIGANDIIEEALKMYFMKEESDGK